VKHLDPSLLASLADGAPAGAAARAHLQACATCRAELEALRALTEALAEAPAPPAALRDATLRRLGIRPSRQRGLLGWRGSWAPLVLAGAAAVLLWQRPAKAPVPAEATIASPPTLDLASVPHPQRAPRSAAEAREKEQDAAVAQAPAAAPAAPAPAAQSAAPAIGSAAPAAPVQVTHLETAPKESPTPAPAGMRVGVRNNLIKPGSALALTIDLPAGSRLLARVFDQRGRAVETLYEGPAGPGSVILRWDAQGAASGAYTVLLQSGGTSRKIQVIVAR
jgi:hypothetical protein